MGLGREVSRSKMCGSSVDASRRVVDAMPSGDVAVSLLTEYHRNPNIAWKRNHIFDNRRTQRGCALLLCGSR